MNSKEKCIAEEYGDYYEDIRLCINKEGFCEYGQKHDNDWGVEPFLSKEDLEIIPIDAYSFKWRPKSLEGIENNNGWIKVESEADLPKETECYHVFSKEDGYLIGTFHTENKGMIEYWLNNYTHYQPIEKPKPPLH